MGHSLFRREQEVKQRFSRLAIAALAAIVMIGGGVLAGPAAAAIPATTQVAQSQAAAALGPNEMLVEQDAAGQIKITKNGALSANKLLKVTFKSVFPQAHPQILKLESGVTLGDVDQNLASGNIRWLTGTRTTAAKVQLHGGQGEPGTLYMERMLGPGTYHIAQMRIVDNVKPSTANVMFTISGSWTVTPQAFQQVSVSNSNRNTNYADSFSTSNTVSSAYPRLVQTGSMITASNKTGTYGPRELHNFAWTQVQPGTTIEQVCASYSGGPNVFVPGGGRQVFGTMSSSLANFANYGLTLPPGEYLVSSELYDGDSLIQHYREIVPGTSPPKCEGVIVKVVAQIPAA